MGVKVAMDTTGAMSLPEVELASNSVHIVQVDKRDQSKLGGKFFNSIYH